MLIVQVSHRFLPEHIGGIETYTLQLSSALAARHRVRVFSCTHDSGPRAQGVEEMEIEGLEVRKVPCLCTAVRQPLLAPFGNERVASEFEAFLRGMEPDVVHIQHSDALAADLPAVCRRAGVPVALTLHDYTFTCPTEYLVDHRGEVCHRTPGSVCLKCVLPEPFGRLSGGPGWAVANGLASLYYHVQKGSRLPPHPGTTDESFTLARIRALRFRIENLSRALAQADRIIAPSRTLADRAERLGIPRGKIQVIPNGIPDQDSSLRGEESVSGRIRFGFVGRVVRIKGVHILVRAFSRLDSGRAELKIHGAGSPTYEPELKAMASGLDGVTFGGRFHPGDLRGILAGIDVLVMPSVCVENMPLVALEALNAGVPVIASEVGGLAEIVRHGENGFLFPMGDEEALTRQMQAFLDEPDLPAEMRERMGRVPSLDDNVRAVEEVYRKITSELRRNRQG